MFTNATLYELYARARRDEDLLPRRARPVRTPTGGLARIIRRFTGPRRPAPRPVPAPAPVRPR